MSENKYTPEQLERKKKEIADTLKKYKKMRRMTDEMIDDYYSRKNVEDFNLGRTQYSRLIRAMSNYRIDTLLKACDILNLEIEIRPKALEGKKDE